MEKKISMEKIIISVLLLAALFSSCSMNDSGSDLMDSGGSGTGGSLASFTIIGDYLYTVDNQQLKIANISDPAHPLYVKSINLGFDIETVFPRGDKLFVGSMWGMYIFDLAQNPESPVQLSFFNHLFSCDPVVADENFAYVTLNAESWQCGRSSNELQIVDISDLSNPKLIFNTSMTSPHGLSVKNDTLYLCDTGLKIFKLAPDRKSISQIQHFNIAATDVINLGNNLLVVGDDGFYQYQIKNNEIKLLSSLLTD